MNTQTKPDETIFELARKMLTLEQRGATDGERAVASAKLDALLEKHGLVRDDLLQAERSQYEFKFQNKFERELLTQIVLMVLNQDHTTSYRWKGQRTKVSFELTKAEFIQVTEMYVYYRSALAERLDEAAQVFFVINELYPNTPGGAERRAMSPEEKARLQRMANIARGMEAEPKPGLKLLEAR